MRALPLWQPWASLVVLGKKRLETRGKRAASTIIGQRVAIHATLTTDYLGVAELDPFADELAGIELPLGALVGTVVVEGCFQMTPGYCRALADADPVEHAFGEYAPGRWAFELRDPQLFSEPIPWKGKQGIFLVPDELLGMPPAQGSLL